MLGNTQSIRLVILNCHLLIWYEQIYKMCIKMCLWSNRVMCSPMHAGLACDIFLILESLNDLDPVLTSFSAVRSGFGPAVRDHRGVLGPRRRGATVGRLRGGAPLHHLQDRQHHQHIYLGVPGLHDDDDVRQQHGPSSQRVQHLNARLQTSGTANHCVHRSSKCELCC